MDFLLFKRFISIEVLIVFYYLGVLILPGGVWYLTRRFVRKYKAAALESKNRHLNELYKKGKKFVWHMLSKQQKIKVILFAALTFIFMNILWRMLFEFLIAYLQMHHALVKLSH